ncbi:tail fiber domain-containing protein [Salmonella enterica]|nr:tail fiber domain-containing protein [Salmonella enterica]
MALYRIGTAAMDAQGVITGTGTKWREPLSLIRTGATIVFLTTPLKLAVISDIVSDTEMKAIQTDGEPVPNGNYVILLNDSLTVDGMAQDVAETLRYYQSKETVIEEAIEFFKNFDLKTLQDLVNKVNADAQQVSTDKAATEQLKNETNQIKADTNAIKTQTQQIKDSAVAEIGEIRNDALDARDAAENAQFAAEQSNIAAGNAKQGAETARDEARQWAQQVNPENLLHKDQNLNDIPNKEAAKIALFLDRFNQGGSETFIQSPDKIKYLTVGNDGWGYWNTQSQQFIPLGVQQGGTGATTADQARKNLDLTEWSLLPQFADRHTINGNIDAVATNSSYTVPPKLDVPTLKGTFPFEQVADLDDGWFYLETLVHSDPNYRMQRATQMTGAWAGSVSIRVMNAGAWGGWMQASARYGMMVNAVENRATFRLNGSANGPAGALVGGAIQSGTFAVWRDRAAAVLAEVPAFDSAVNIFKSVKWGSDWTSGMDTVLWSSGGAENHLYVKGSEYVFDHAGNATANQWINISDIRMKAHLKEIDSASEKIEQLTGYTYYKRNNFVEDERTIYSIEAGLIAQDLENVLPEAVHSLNNDGELDPEGKAIKGINYNGVVALLVNGFKEQKAKIESQQEEINTLLNELDELKKLVNSMINGSESTIPELP